MTLYYIVPVDREAFDASPEDILGFSTGSQPLQILHFLLDHPEEAFSQTEIHEATEINRNSVGVVLLRLEEEGLVEHRGRYWAVARDDRLKTYAAARSEESSASDTWVAEDND